MSSRYSEKIIKKIRREILCGKTKHQVAKEMGLSDKVVCHPSKTVKISKKTNCDSPSSQKW